MRTNAEHSNTRGDAGLYTLRHAREFNKRGPVLQEIARARRVQDLVDSADPDTREAENLRSEYRYILEGPSALGLTPYGDRVYRMGVRHGVTELIADGMGDLVNVGSLNEPEEEPAERTELKKPSARSHSLNPVLRWNKTDLQSVGRAVEAYNRERIDPKDRLYTPKPVPFMILPAMNGLTPPVPEKKPDALPWTRVSDIGVTPFVFDAMTSLRFRPGIADDGEVAGRKPSVITKNMSALIVGREDREPLAVPVTSFLVTTFGQEFFSEFQEYARVAHSGVDPITGTKLPMKYDMLAVGQSGILSYARLLNHLYATDFADNKSMQRAFPKGTTLSPHDLMLHSFAKNVWEQRGERAKMPKEFLERMYMYVQRTYAELTPSDRVMENEEKALAPYNGFSEVSLGRKMILQREVEEQMAGGGNAAARRIKTIFTGGRRRVPHPFI